MREPRQSQKGVSFIEVLVTLFILMGMATLMVTTTRFFAQNQQEIRMRTEYDQILTSKVSELYTTTSWDMLRAENIPTSDEPIAITYHYGGISPDYQTHVLDVTVTRANQPPQTFQLERSVRVYE